MLGRLSVRAPVPSRISKQLYRQTSQDVCPWNRKFAKELSEAVFAPRASLEGKDARSLTVELLSMSQPEFSSALKGSPMKRAKLRGLTAELEVNRGVWCSAQGDQRGLQVRAPHPFNRLHDDHQVVHPVIEKNLAVLGACFIPHGGDVSDFVDDAGETLPSVSRDTGARISRNGRLRPRSLGGITHARTA